MFDTIDGFVVNIVIFISYKLISTSGFARAVEMETSKVIPIFFII